MCGTFPSLYFVRFVKKFINELIYFSTPQSMLIWAWYSSIWKNIISPNKDPSYPTKTTQIGEMQDWDMLSLLVLLPLIALLPLIGWRPYRFRPLSTSPQNYVQDFEITIQPEPIHQRELVVHTQSTSVNLDAKRPERGNLLEDPHPRSAEPSASGPHSGNTVHSATTITNPLESKRGKTLKRPRPAPKRDDRREDSKKKKK